MNYLRAHPSGVIRVIALVLAATLAVSTRHMIPAKLAEASKGILKFAQGHPHLLRVLHVVLYSVPDIAYLLLAFAGLSYLMPDLAKKIEKTRTTRWTVFAVFATFGIATIILNAISREDQEHQRQEQESKVDGVRHSVDALQAQLANNRGQPNEAERRKQLLEALRDEYVISTPNAPVTMLTGTSYPSAEWVNKRLKQLGEKWSFNEPLKPAPNASTTAPCTPGRPRINAGPDGYKGVCDEDLGQWVIDEAQSIGDLAETCVTNLNNSIKDKDNQSGIKFFFRAEFNKTYAQEVKELHTEAMTRLGPAGRNSEEQTYWENLFPDQSPQPNIPPEFKSRIPHSFHEVSCGSAKEYAPYLHVLGVKLKRRVVPRNPPRPLHFSETQVTPIFAMFKFGVKATIDTKVPISAGYFVAEFSSVWGDVGSDLGKDTPPERSWTIDNKSLFDYLDMLPHQHYYVFTLGKTPFTSDKPRHVGVDSINEIHVTKVTWFDE